MKEAASEANLTVIAIVLIGVVAAIATPLISNLLKGTAEKACCSNAGGVWKQGGCKDPGNGSYDSTTYSTCISESSNKND